LCAVGVMLCAVGVMLLCAVGVMLLYRNCTVLNLSLRCSVQATACTSP
jgi:hypothetical protein